MKLLQRISNHLLINAPQLPDLGLFHGKMGICLFFYEYSRFTENSIYNDFADILVEQIYSQINTTIPFNLENGLCGIGWGFEYLMVRGFVDPDSKDILAPLDREIMKTDLRRLTDLSFNKGVEGVLFYVIARLYSAFSAGRKPPFDKVYLEDMYNTLLANKNYFFKKEIIESFIHYMEAGTISDNPICLPDSLFTFPDEIIDIPASSLGLFEGLTGRAFSLIRELQADRNL